MVKKGHVDRMARSFDIVVKNGITIAEIEKMNYREFNKTFGTNKSNNKSMKGEIRLMKQAWNNRKAVLKHYEKKHGIKDKKYRNFLRKRMVDLLKPKKEKEKKKKKAKKPKKPPKWTDIKVNGSVHGKQVSFTIKSYEELKKFLDDLEGSNRDFSRLKNCIVTGAKKGRKDISINDMKEIYNVYYNFDYGSKTGFFGGV